LLARRLVERGVRFVQLSTKGGTSMRGCRAAFCINVGRLIRPVLRS